MNNANNIRAYRRLLIIRQKDFADMLGVSPVCLSMYENGGREPNIKRIKEIISLFKRLGLEDVIGEKVTFETIFPN